MLRKEYNAGIEFARVLACLIVVGCHTKLPALVDGTYYYGRMLGTMLVADGVTIFWIISGFNFFKESDYKKFYLRLFKKILLPTVLVMLFYFYFKPLIDGNASTFKAVFARPLSDYSVFLASFWTWTPLSGCGYLWYIFVYLFLALFYPFIRPVALYLDESRGARKYFLILSAVLLFSNSLNQNNILHFSNHTTNGMAAALIFMLWGYIIYRHIKGADKFALLGLAAFLGINLVRAYLGMKEQYIMLVMWHAFPALLAAVCILYFSFAFVNRLKSDKLENAARFLGSHTFTIYLIHNIFIDVFRALGFEASFSSMLISRFGDTPGYFLYLIFSACLVFILSLLASIVLRQLKHLVFIKRR